MNQRSVAWREAAAAARTNAGRAATRARRTGAVVVRRGRSGNSPVARRVTFSGPRHTVTVRRTAGRISPERRYARA